jgi:hypothetical protein
VDHICIISIKFGGNWLFTGFQNMFFDTNFLFFVTVTATLDDSRRSSIKILKEDHICILSTWFDCIWFFTGFWNIFLMNFFTNFLFIVTMVAMFDGGCGPQPLFWKNITYVSNLIAIYNCSWFFCWFYPYVLFIDMVAMMVGRQGHRT